MTIRANHIAFGDFVFDGFQFQTGSLIKLMFFDLIFTVVKIHYIKRILNSAVGTGFGFRLMDKVPAFFICPQISLRLILFDGTVNKPFHFRS